MPISLNRDLEKYGRQCLGLKKSVYGLAATKTSDISLEKAELEFFKERIKECPLDI